MRILDAQSEAFDNLDPSKPEDMRTAFGEVIEMLDQALELAPAEIRVTIQTGRDLFVELSVALDEVDYDFTKLTPDTLQRFQELGTTFQETFTKIGEFAEAECEVEG